MVHAGARLRVSLLFHQELRRDPGRKRADPDRHGRLAATNRDTAAAACTAPAPGGPDDEASRRMAGRTCHVLRRGRLTVHRNSPRSLQIRFQSIRPGRPDPPREMLKSLSKARALRADSVSYHSGGDQLTISGPIRVTDEDGTVFLADYADLDGSLRDGLLVSARMVLRAAFPDRGKSHCPYQQSLHASSTGLSPRLAKFARPTRYRCGKSVPQTSCTMMLNTSSTSRMPGCDSRACRSCTCHGSGCPTPALTAPTASLIPQIKAHVRSRNRRQASVLYRLRKPSRPHADPLPLQFDNDTRNSISPRTGNVGTSRRSVPSQTTTSKGHAGIS